MLHRWPRLTSLIVTLCLLSPVLANDDDPVSDPLPEGAVMRLGTSGLAHGERLTHVKFSANDKYLGAADAGGTIRVWNPHTGHQLRELPPQIGHELAFSPDSKTLATGGYANDWILFWNLQTGEVARRIRLKARTFTYSPDGTMFAADGEDGLIRLYDPATNELIRMFGSRRYHVHALAFSPDGRLLASAGENRNSRTFNEVMIWEVATGKQVKSLPVESTRLNAWHNVIKALDFSHDGKRLAAADSYATTVWDLEENESDFMLKHSGYDVDFSPTTDRLVTGGQYNIYDSQNGLEKIKLDVPVGAPGCVAYSHDGKLIATGNPSGDIQLWDAATGKELSRKQGHEGGVRGGVFSPDGTLIASISRTDSTIRIWGATTGKQLLTLPVTFKGPDVWWNEEGSKVWFAPYGRDVLTWTYNRHAVFWRVATQAKHSQQLKLDRSHGTYNSQALVVAYSPSGHQMATAVAYGSHQLSVHVFDLDGGKLVSTIRPIDETTSSDAWVSSLTYSPDGKLLAIGAMVGSHRDRTGRSVEVWDVDKNRRVHHLRWATSPPGNVCFSPNGKLLATSSTIGTPVQVWRVSDGKEVASFPADIDYHGREMAPLAFSPDSQLLAAADKNRVIHVWELATQKKTHTFRGHIKAVNSLAFSPDGKTLLSSSEDTTLLAWNVRGADIQHAAKPLTDTQLAGYWEALADRDSDLAAKAAQALISRPHQTVTWLNDHLTAGPVLHEEEIPQLVKQLASEDPRVHLKASIKLERFGKAASPALFTALTSADERAYRERIESILSQTGKYPIPPEQLQRERAISVLEKIATPSAQALLKSIAAHDPPTATSEEAQAALDRLEAYRRAPSADKP